MPVEVKFHNNFPDDAHYKAYIERLVQQFKQDNRPVTVRSLSDCTTALVLYVASPYPLPPLQSPQPKDRDTLDGAGDASSHSVVDIHRCFQRL